MKHTGGRAVRYGAFPVIALASTLMLEQGERLSLAQALDGIRAEFGVGRGAVGALASAMVLVGVVGGIPIGVLADRWRRATLLAIAMGIWTVCMGLGAIAPGFVFLFVGRLGIGVVEANGPAAVSLLSDFYPVATRARMMGRYQVGGIAGGLVGVGLSGVLVDTFGWRAAFWMWIPFGLFVVLLLTRLPEPERGAQDRAFHHEATTGVESDGVPGIQPDLHLPAARPSDLDYDNASWLEVFAELRHIRSMWFAVMSLTISTFLSGALQVWGIDFFKDAFDLSATKAGAFIPVVGGGAAIGLLTGGEIADWMLRKGIVNARVYVTAVSSVLASVFFLPGFLTSSLPLATVMLFFGSLFLTTPIAPSEALMADVVPAGLRGRAAAIRSIVRALAALAPWIVGLLADVFDLPTALAMVTPLYAIGGLVMLLAARSYPSDLAAAAAETARRGAPVT